MSELLNQLITAHTICAEAYTHFYRALDFENANIFIRRRRTFFIVAAVLFLFFSLSFHMPIVPMFFQEISDNNLTFIKIFRERHYDFILALGISLTLSIILFLLVLKPLRMTNIIEQNNENKKREIALGQKIFNDNINDLAILPPDYCEPKATTYLVKVVRDGRAYTINEALSMCDTYLHRERVENANQQMLTMQQQQSEYLRSIKTRSGIAAAASVDNFLRKR